jgi:hypothetical protein
MASLWTRGDSGDLVERRLDSGACAPAGPQAAPVRVAQGLSLVPTRGWVNAEWVLVANVGARVTVNSEALPTGIRVLDTRDEIRCGLFAAVFTDERAARVESFPGGSQPVCCARCACDIQPSSPAIRCPACGSWHHQQDPGDLPCWTAVSFCQVCGFLTQSGNGEWTPEGL